MAHDPNNLKNETPKDLFISVPSNPSWQKLPLSAPSLYSLWSWRLAKLAKLSYLGSAGFPGGSGYTGKIH